MKTKFSGILTLLLAFVVQISFAQEKTVSGTVTDDQGLPLPGVNVIVKGTQTGTQTDFDGIYTIDVAEGESLVISYVGFTKQEIEIGASNTYDVQLEAGNTLEDVIVTAYSSQKRDEVTSAVSAVNVDAIDQMPIASIDQALQGLAPGVNVKVSSGQPGRSGAVIIRGRSSINGAIDPLYIIDGVPVDPDTFRSLNSNDFASISILKDAAATALYGNRATNGVIIATTKTGKFDSPLTINYRSLYGVSLHADPNFNVLNASQRLRYERDVIGDGYGAGLNDAEIAAIGRQTNTNWSDFVFQQGRTLSHQLSFSKGSENTRSYTSIGYYNQEGITKNSELERFNIRTNFDGKSENGKFDYSTKLSVNYSKSSFVVDRDRNSTIFGANTGGELDNPFIVPYLGLPYFNPYNPNGSINYLGTFLSGGLNEDGTVSPNGANGFLNTPFLALNTARFNTDRENELKLIGNITANYHFADKFTVGLSYASDYTFIDALNIDTPGSIRGLVTPNVNSQFKGQQVENYNRFYTSDFNPYIKYSDEFDKHSVEVAAFGEYLYQNFQSGGFQAFGLNPNLPGSGSGFQDGATVEDPNDTPDDPADDARYYIPNVFSSETEDALYSYFGTANYDYDKRYGFSGSIRRDGTSRFTEENRWGTFWAVSGRWNIHNEAFLNGSDVVTNLKLRASYGLTGNRNVSPGNFYVGFDRISTFSGYQGAPAYAPTALVDPDLQWEETRQANIGIDFGFFKDRLVGSVDVYDKNTDGLFFPTPVSLTTGFGTVQSNIAEVSNKGVEVQFKYDIIRNDDFRWSVNANAAYNKNEVESLASGQEIQNTGNTAISVGDPLRTFNLVRWAGVNPANGKPLYYDSTGNLTETFSDDNRVLMDKSADPTYTGGFGTDVQYKGFFLNGFFSFAADQWRTNGSLALLTNAADAINSNQAVQVLDAWQQPGDITAIPDFNSGASRLNATDRYLEDASFLRLRNVSIGYNLTPKTLEKIKFINGLRVYVQGTNLLTWSKWRGFDPESTFTSSFFDYPTPRQFTAGVELKF
jgi:TonB-linked SusC/RagA family outer membrane protein